MKKGNVENSNNSFLVMYNSLSIGWHLKKIIELEPDILKDKESYRKFQYWLNRHIEPKEIKL